jgi:hypothetical protein
VRLPPGLVCPKQVTNGVLAATIAKRVRDVPITLDKLL